MRATTLGAQGAADPTTATRTSSVSVATLDDFEGRTDPTDWGPQWTVERNDSTSFPTTPVPNQIAVAGGFAELNASMDIEPDPILQGQADSVMEVRRPMAFVDLDASHAYHLEATVTLGGISGAPAEVRLNEDFSIIVIGTNAEIAISRIQATFVGFTIVPLHEEVDFIAPGAGNVGHFSHGLTAGPVTVSIDWDPARGTYIFSHSLDGTVEHAVTAGTQLTPTSIAADIAHGAHVAIPPGGVAWPSAAFTCAVDDVKTLKRTTTVVPADAAAEVGLLLRGRR